MIKAYLATHFFNEAGFQYTENLAKRIREAVDIDLYVPQENAEINDKSNDENITAEAITLGDNKYLINSNILIASLDGVEIDSGVSAEIGFFSGLMFAEKRYCILPTERYIIGIYTDIRKDGTGDNHYYINLYTKGLIKINGQIAKDSEELINVLTDIIKTINIKTQLGGKI